MRRLTPETWLTVARGLAEVDRMLAAVCWVVETESGCKDSVSKGLRSLRKRLWALRKGPVCSRVIAESDGEVTEADVSVIKNMPTVEQVVSTLPGKPIDGLVDSVAGWISPSDLRSQFDRIMTAVGDPSSIREVLASACALFMVFRKLSRESGMPKDVCKAIAFISDDLDQTVEKKNSAKQPTDESLN